MQNTVGAHSKGTWCMEEGQAQEDLTREVAFEQRSEREYGLYSRQPGSRGEGQSM